jgi:predicted nucleic acid-binding protein
LLTDANIFVYHLTGQQDYGTICSGFLKRVELSEINGVTSVLIIDEAIYGILITNAANILKITKISTIRNHLKNDKKLCKRCYQDAEIFLDYIDALRDGGLELIDSINYRIFRDLLPSVQAGITGLPHDLIHIKLCRDLKIDHIATQDSDFDNVPGLTVWKPRDN